MCKLWKMFATVRDLFIFEKRKRYGARVNASKFVVVFCKVGVNYFRFFSKATNIFNKKIKISLQL